MSEFSRKWRRRPLRNFIYHPSVQWPLIVSNTFLALGAILVTALAIVIAWLFKFHGQGFFMLGGDSAYVPMERVSFASVLWPVVAFCALTAVAAGVLLAVVTSRKVALPIYKVTRWAHRVAGGELSLRLGFRSGDHMEELAEACNQVTERTAAAWMSLDDLRHREDVPADVRRRVQKIFEYYHLDQVD